MSPPNFPPSSLVTEVALGLSFAILGVAVLENATVNVYFHVSDAVCAPVCSVRSSDR